MAESAFDGDPIVVEEVIPPPSDLSPVSCCSHSPSIEAYIDPHGNVQITYACAQLLDSDGHFSGVLIDRHSLPGEIAGQMWRCAEFIGHNLASRGYFGHFDLDFVVGRDLRAYVVEGNPRRTGGTHAHELATFLFGPSYLEEQVVLARTVTIPLRVASWSKIVLAASDLMFRAGTKAAGVIPVVTSGLGSGIVGYVVLARSAREALASELRFLDAIGRPHQ